MNLENKQKKDNKYFYGFPDSLDYKLYFFNGKNGRIQVRTSTNNILSIQAQTPFYDVTYFEFYLDGALLNKHNYKTLDRHPSNLTCQELKEVREEFEAEILPKIKECIDIVKQKGKNE